MKYVLSNAQMRAADRYTIEGGVPSLDLMERAGKALANSAIKLANGGEVLCVCGGGNNGGDGFVCARLLREAGVKTTAFCNAEKRSPDCAEMEKRWIACGGRTAREFPEGEYALVIDCLYGTGFHGSLKGEDIQTVERIAALRARGAKVLACDIPSGVNGENGQAEKVAVAADVTLCIGERKLGVYLGEGIDRAGKIERADIGILLPEKEYISLADEELVNSLLPKRRRNSHKGSYGKAAIVGGSEEYLGAPYLSAAACLRVGAGYTLLFVPEKLKSLYALKSPELLVRASSEGCRYAFNENFMRELLLFDSVAYGMGMGKSEEVYKGVKWLLEQYTGKLIIDADGLNSLAEYGEISLLERAKCEVVLTPHAKEFSRLSAWSVAEILDFPVQRVTEFAKTCKGTVLLKNAVSLITDGERISLNATGNSGLAKGGSGDVLSGIIAGLCAQGADGYSAAIAGSYLLGKSAEIAAKKMGEYSLLATDVVENLGGAFLFLAENAHEHGGKE